MAKEFDTILVEVVMARTNKSGPKVFASFLEKLQIFAGKKFNTEHKLVLNIWKRKESYRFIIEMAKADFKYITDQLYSFFPDAEIYVGEESPFFVETNFVGSANLVLENNDVYALRTYEDFEEDEIPLNSILSSLNKTRDEEALYRLELEPYGNDWHNFSKSVATIFLNQKKKGKLNLHEKLKLAKLYKEISFSGSIVLSIINIKNWIGSKFFTESKTETIDLTEGVVEITKEEKKEENLDREVAGREKSIFVNKILEQGYKTKFSIHIGTNKNLGNDFYKNRLSEITQSLATFGRPYINKFKLDEKTFKFSDKAEVANKYNYYSQKEIASLFHFPIETMIKQPGIFWRGNVTLPPPEDLPLEDEEGVALIGTTRYRDYKKEFGLLPKDRRRHMYVIGKTGMGKSTLLENMIADDIKAGRGTAIIDPHGDTAEAAISFVPNNRINDVIIFDPSDYDNPIGFNLLENISPEMNTVVANGIVSIFKKMNLNSWGPRLEHILYNTLLTLLQVPNTSLLAVSRIMVDREYRKYVVEQIDDPVLLAFWNEEIGRMQEKMLVEAFAPIQNKIGPFMSSPMMRNIVGQSKNQLSIRHVMDNKKILICNLSKGKIGELNSAMLGAMLITKFQIDAMQRAAIPSDDRVDFYLYVDEFQNFATESFAVILSEARKYKLNLTVANQYIGQMPEEVKDAVFGNIGTILNFQIGFDDATYIANQYENLVTPQDLMGLGVGQAYCRLLIRNLPTKAFSITTSAPREPDLTKEALISHVEKVKRISRERYTTPKEEVLEKIRKWNEPKLSKSALEKQAKEEAKRQEYLKKKEEEAKSGKKDNKSNSKPKNNSNYKKNNKGNSKK